MATSWFVFNGPVGGTLNAVNYSTVGITPSCSTGVTVCAIFAEVQILSGLRKPIITAALQSEITTAKNTPAPSANVRLKP